MLYINVDPKVGLGAVSF